MTNTAYLLLGSNDDAPANLRGAVDRLAALDPNIGRFKAVSGVFESPAAGDVPAPAYLNAAVILETPLDAATLKAEVLRPIEAALGRVRPASGEKPVRVPLDIDIVLFNQDVIDLGKRGIPDPDLLTHAHVAVPLAQLAPDYAHPVTGQTLVDIVVGLPDRHLISRPGIRLV
ncbi:MAG: 2-amino-4-hydroxy-6-hydroxymethyldihydropteridine diphosphokinase [Chloroflexota bacterium]